MSRKRSPEEQVEALQHEIVEGVLATDASTLEAMVREEGRDPRAVAEEVRQRLNATVREFHARRRNALKTQHAQSVARLGERRRALPATPVERRALLGRAVGRSRVAAEAVTIQHREFKELTDEDVTSLLGRLADLGALPPEDDPDESGSAR